MTPRDADYISRLRAAVGTRKVFLVFTTVVLRDDQSRVLLQRRTDFDFWGLPGGALELGETLDKCARRELREETGLEAGALTLVGIYTDPRYDVTYPNGDEVQQFTICFHGTARGGTLRADGRETRGHRFFAAGALPWKEMPIWYRDMVRDALALSAPAFRPARVSTRAPDRETRLPLWQNGDVITTSASVAVCDGPRVLLATAPGEQRLHFPTRFMRLGENAAGTARRALMEGGPAATITRIVAVYAGIDLVASQAGGGRWNAGVLFAAAPDSREVTPSVGPASVSWSWIPLVDLEQRRLRVTEPAFYARVAQHLRGGQFVI